MIRIDDSTLTFLLLFLICIGINYTSQHHFGLKVNEVSPYVVIFIDPLLSMSLGISFESFSPCVIIFMDPLLSMSLGISFELFSPCVVIFIFPLLSISLGIIFESLRPFLRTLHFSFFCEHLPSRLTIFKLIPLIKA